MQKLINILAKSYQNLKYHKCLVKTLRRLAPNGVKHGACIMQLRTLFELQWPIVRHFWKKTLKKDFQGSKSYHRA